MLLYFGYSNTNATNVTVAQPVKDRGLDLLKAKPNEMHPCIVLTSIQPGYSSYLKHLPVHMHATQTGQTVTVRAQAYPIAAPNNLLPWKLPSVIYHFRNKPNDALRTTLSAHSYPIQKGKDEQFIMRNPTLEQIRNLVTTHRPENNTRHILNTVNIESLRALIVIRNIISSFIRTHRFPAFRHETDIAHRDLDEITQPIIKKRKINTVSAVECYKQPDQHIEAAGDETEYVPKQGETYNDIIQLTRAKPSTQNDMSLWGPLNTLPNSSGIFAPYVRDLAISDNQTVPGLLADYFAQGLAPNLDGIMNSIDQIKSAWGTICQTDTGHEVTHLCKCIDIALRAQCYVYPVYTNGVYEGTAILGAGYTMHLCGRTYMAIPYAELQEEVRDGSMHTLALSTINDAVAGLNLADLGTITTMRELSEIVKEEALDDFQRQTIVKAAHNLTYATGYWSTSASNVVKMMEFLSSDTEIDVDVPMHPAYLFTADRIESVLSAFGHSAPSFMILGGKRINVTDKSPPRTFGIRTVAITTAIADMKYVRENNMITNDKTNLSRKHGDSTLTSTVKTNTWKMLQTFCNANSEDGETAGVAPQPTGGNLFDDVF